MTDCKYPIAKCPKCGRTIVYSDDPRDKKNVSLCEATADYHGRTVLCAKCKTMLAIIEKPKAAKDVIRVPIVNADF